MRKNSCSKIKELKKQKTYHTMNKYLKLKEQMIVPSSIKTKKSQICGSIRCIYSNRDQYCINS